ncbi:hypothetical protein [Rossellomorea aquimaris]|uniref:hypothetical protein n=1 Tax=Rossellomorea aquimaris TaxID=189382 RepID=UPI0007D0471F|nr:hypothetical protein [Rossellomorea aquimaris]
MVNLQAKYLKRKYLSVLILTLLFVSSSCWSSEVKNDRLTENSIKQFISEKGLEEPLGTNLISDDRAVVIYIGYLFEVWKRNDDIRSRKVSYTNNNEVSIVGSAEGNPYIAITILDEKILKKAERVSIHFEDGYELSREIEDKKAFAISYDKKHSEQYVVEFYDSKGEIIYSI